jgi:S-adenosylmethionine decarboxylase
MHLAVDGYTGATEKLQDPELLRRFLDQYPASLGMTKLVPPTVVTYRGPVPEDWGLSGFVIIAESHISVHTFPARHYIWVDIFSCKEFDHSKALQELQKVFSLASAKSWALQRGLEHYNPEEAQRALEAGRARLAVGAPE